ncbi:hypothetical protein Tco_0414947 [Tanacetum coccineum]
MDVDIFLFSKEVCESIFIEHVPTNKASVSGRDFSRLQSPFNSRYELIAPCHVLLGPESRIHTRIEPLDLEFLNSVSQCFQNTCQRAITELVYFVKLHDLSFIVVDREHYCSRRLNEVQLCLVAFNAELKIINPLSNH